MNVGNYQNLKMQMTKLFSDAQKSGTMDDTVKSSLPASDDSTHFEQPLTVKVQASCFSTDPGFISPIHNEAPHHFSTVSDLASPNSLVDRSGFSVAQRKLTSTPVPEADKSHEVKLAECLLSPNSTDYLATSNEKSAIELISEFDGGGGTNCAMCLHPFKDKWGLCDHLKTCHNFGVSFKCSICSSTYLTTEMCCQHIKQDHGENKPDVRSHKALVVCRVCGKTFPKDGINDNMVINNHILNHYYKLYPIKRPYLCLDCDALLYGHVAFFAHKQSHDIDRRRYLRDQVLHLNGSFEKLLLNQPLFCYLCETLYIGSNQFYSHHTTFHGDHLCCHSCSLGIDSLEELNIHIIAHTQKNLFAHTAMKEEATRFLCVVCDQYADGKTAFKEHFVLNHAMQLDDAVPGKMKNVFDPECARQT